MFENPPKSTSPKQYHPESQKPHQPAKPQPLDVHVMPSQFHLHKPKKDFSMPPGGKKSKTTLYVMLGVGAVVVIGLGVIGYLVYQRNANKELSNTNSKNLNTNTVKLNFNTNRANTNGNTNGNQNANANSNTNGNANANSNTNTSAIVPFASLTSSADSDSDGLTDTEEEDYTTKVNSADSDADTFKDGAEVALGYSPISKGKLDGTAIIRVYNNLNYGFSFIYPKTWTLQQRGEGKLGVIITSPAGDEYIDVSVQENVGRLTPTQWYLEQNTAVNASQVTAVQNFSKTVDGVRSVDGLSYHYASGNYVYTVYYGITKKDKVDYKTTFLMIAGSLDILPPTAILNSNTNTNDNTNANANANTNSNTNANANTNTAANVNANSNSNTNANANANLNANTNLNTNA